MEANKKDIEKPKMKQKRDMPPAALLSPVPAVIVSCKGEHTPPNVLTIAWAGTICSDPPMVSISVRPTRYSHALISQTKEFVINLVNQKLLKACDYCGVKSGADEEKWKSAGLKPIEIKTMHHAPAISESPLSIACRVNQVVQAGSHDIFMAHVTHIIGDERYFDANGKLCLEKAGLVCFAHGDYYAVGKRLGFFGFSVASPKAYKRRMSPNISKQINQKQRSAKKTYEKK